MVTRCDAAALLAALEAATARLEANVDEVNALNVYPVPDGDTGTNMLHTMKTALDHARKADLEPAAVLAGATHGALMGARGNSGVLLSQIIRGVKDAAGEDGIDIKKAFKLGRDYSYAAVTKPAGGTMLSALKEMQDAVDHAKGDAEQLLGVAVDKGRAAVDRTMHENPVNKAAGVVDAGARGLWLLIDGALASLEGRFVAGPVARAAGGPAAAAEVVAHEVASWAGAYDVQFLITAPSRPVETIRNEMLEFGADCVLVVGDETVAKVHVHTLQPDQIIRIGTSAGRISDVVVEDLDAMSAEHEATTGIAVASPSRETVALAVVAVVPGDGLSRVAASLGAQVVRGGATMNPSTAQILKNVVLAAQQAAQLAGPHVIVLDVRNVAQGMAALASWDQGETPDAAIAAMRDAAEGAHAIEITKAVRDADVDGQKVGKGQHLALLDGRMVAHDDDELTALVTAAGTLSGTGLFTLYVGADVDDKRREAAAARLRATFPGAEVEVVDGGQPHYPFIVAAE